MQAAATGTTDSDPLATATGSGSMSESVWKSPPYVDASSIGELRYPKDRDPGMICGEVALDPFNLDNCTDSIIGIGQHVLWGNIGGTSQRIVLKRVQEQDASYPAELEDHEHILLPHYLITNSIGTVYACYSYSPNGNLREKIMHTFGSGRQVSPPDAAQVMLGVMKAAIAMMERGISITVLRTDEIFVDQIGNARVRIRNDEDPTGQGATGPKAKWLAPEECEFPTRPKQPQQLWPIVAYRIGLLLYCIGAASPDPYPQKKGELVLQALMGEVAGTAKPCRPRMRPYKHPSPLRELVESCLSAEASDRPRPEVLTQVLHSVASPYPSIPAGLTRLWTDSKEPSS
jgi:hypothetical protein